jgi:EAL domain-containing protein (putative c-di-GMP-specific phosphodiesterase class I)
VAVNLSARVLHANLVDEVAAVLGPGTLELEVTESAAMRDPERSLAVLHGLAALGIRLSVDDFGTGHSSLAYLARLPVAALKIDRAFVAGLDTEAANRSIVSTTVELGQRLGLEVVAEGAEDDAALAVLRTLGCDLAQGFGIARPMPADAVPEWAAARAPAGLVEPN